VTDYVWDKNVLFSIFFGYGLAFNIRLFLWYSEVKQSTEKAMLKTAGMLYPCTRGVNGWSFQRYCDY
jgi:hypothetical protein